MLLTPQNAGDIERYFRHTYVKLSGYGDKLFFIQTVTSSEVAGDDEDGNAFVIYLDAENPFSLEYVLPNKALFPYKDNICMLERIPARQYKRGICGDNCQITSIYGGDRFDISFTTLKAFVNKQTYPTLREALFGKSKQKVFALNSRMSLQKSTGRIMLDRSLIAVFERQTGKLHIDDRFTEEVKNLLKLDPFPVTYQGL